MEGTIIFGFLCGLFYVADDVDAPWLDRILGGAVGGTFVVIVMCIIGYIFSGFPGF